MPGVANVPASRAFYEALGWTRAAAGKAFWGGYTGVFVDPDGHPWEGAFNPGWPLRDDGSVDLPS
jgi:uncharacterized protein